MDEDTPVDILVVDDEAEIADVIAEFLRGEGYTVEVAYDGASALERARLRLPALLISDVRMPRISGYELAVRIRQSIAGVCAIFISALSQALPPPPFGVLIAKPFNFDRLLDLVQQMLGRRSEGGGGGGNGHAAHRAEPVWMA